MTKIFNLYKTPILKVYRNHVNVSSPVKRSMGMGMGMGVAPEIQPPTLVGPPLLSTRLTATHSNNSCFSYGNPCLDLFFNVRLEHPYASLFGLDDDPKPLYSREYLKQLLPKAWSHDPLTTLKLIFNLLDTEVYHETGKNDKQGFYAAAYWLYQNHPKTLACNVAPIAGSFGAFEDLLETLYRTLEGEDMRRRRNQKTNAIYQEIKKGIPGRTSSGRRREKIFALANKAIERYQRDPNYRFFHDRVSDLFAQCFKYDIHMFNKQHQIDDQNDEPKRLELTHARYHCPRVDSSYDRATLLCESIAKKLFPRESEEEEEADYTCRVREKLKKEVLVPLRKPMEDWRVYHIAGNREPCAVKMYLEEVKTGGKSKIKASALLPNEIVRYVDDADVGQAAELQWKTMVEDIYLKQGKFKNCLVAYDISGTGVFSWHISEALALLASQLSEDPWKGKMISFCDSSKPELHSIQGEGNDDLKSKCEFVRGLDFGEDYDVNHLLQKMLDLILQVAVDANLKPDQMLKKVFVITYSCQKLDEEDSCWESDYEAIQSKFKDKGYAVPQIVIWNMSHGKSRPVRSTKQMGGVITGYSNNLFKTFLDNDGEIDPDHVMEAAISGKKYQDLVVVD